MTISEVFEHTLWQSSLPSTATNTTSNSDEQTKPNDPVATTAYGVRHHHQQAYLHVREELKQLDSLIQNIDENDHGSNTAAIRTKIRLLFELVGFPDELISRYNASRPKLGECGGHPDELVHNNVVVDGKGKAKMIYPAEEKQNEHEEERENGVGEDADQSDREGDNEVCSAPGR